MDANFQTDRLMRMVLETFNETGSASVEGLQQVRDVQVVMGALLQHEAQRLEHKLGTEHLRVQQIRSSLEQNQAVTRDLDVELEIAQVRIPTVDPKDVLIHGRVVDENQRGLAGLTVLLENVRGGIIRALGQAETQPSGYYALPIQAAVLERVASSINAGVFVVVCNPKGERIYRHKDPLRLVNGDRHLVNIALRRFDQTPLPCEPPCPDGEDDTDRDAWVVRGRVTNQQGQGMAGLVVSLYDRDLIFDDRLGTKGTDGNGNFAIAYRTEDFRDLFEANPDLYIKVMDRQENTLYSSEDAVRCEAGRFEVFDITINREMIS
jgi:hypothetical protein